MTNSQPQFTSEQVTAAIRAAFSPRWDTSLAPDEAVNKANTYRSGAAHYRGHIRRSLSESDYLQVAEKSWGAFTQTLKAIGADHRIMLSSHVGIIRVARQLSDLLAETDPDAAKALNLASTSAHSLHTHFYENDLPDAMVADSAAAVIEAIDLLQNCFPTPTDADA